MLVDARIQLSLPVRMKMWVAVVGVLALASGSYSTFVYPADEDSVLPGVRTMPTRRNPGREMIHFPTDDLASPVRHGGAAPVPLPDPQPEMADLPDDLHAVSASGDAKGRGVPAPRDRLRAC